MARIRPVTLADKDAWVRSLLGGYEVDPQFQWRYSRRKEFPEDVKIGAGKFLDRILENHNQKCFVAELPMIEGKILENRQELENYEESRNVEWVVVATAAWEFRDWEDVENQTGKD
jgi:hypothetical protein